MYILKLFCNGFEILEEETMESANKGIREEGVGDVLRLLRKAEDISIKDLATKLNVSSAYISEIESNKKKPTWDMLSRYSEVFNTDMSVILYFEEERKRKKYDHKKLLLEILKKLVGEESN